MRILYDLRYASDHFAGIGTHAHELLRALLASAVDERYQVLWRRGDTATRFSIEEFANHPAVDWIETTAPPLGASVPWTTGACVRSSGADVYLSPFYLRPWRPGIPVVLTLHDAMHLAPEVGASLSLRLKFQLALMWAAGADAVITSSRFSRDEIVRRTGIPGFRLHVVPLGTPERTVDPHRPAGVPERPFALVVGGNRPHKNLRLLARVWQSFGDSAPLDLVVAGAVDPRYPDLPALGGTPRTHGLGAVSAAELEWLYANATLLLFPTLYEGFGLPVMEAASRGLSVLCSDIPALRESGEGFAEFLPARDERAWRERIDSFCAAPEARVRGIAAGRAAAAQLRYSLTATGVRQVLREVVERAR